MKTTFRSIFALILLGILGFGRTITVHEYTKKNGTVVREHTREIKDHPSAPILTGATPIARTPDGRIKRDLTARRDFMSHTLCPATNSYSLQCPGYVVDHVIPLSCGGADQPYNMQYQTVADAKEKDKWERSTCGGQ